MPRSRGYAVTTLDGATIEEEDTYTCGHCNAIVPVAPFQTDTDSCLRCDHHICPKCVAELVRTLKCVPFEARIEKLEASARLRNSIG